MAATFLQHRIRWALTACLLLHGSGAVAGGQAGTVVRDPYYGEALFHFYQQDHFTALSHLAYAQSQQRVPHHAYEAELLKGGLLLSWGQHDAAGKIFEHLLQVSQDASVRDRAWFYLGKVKYQRGYLAEAEQALESIVASLPTELEAERYDLLARLYMDQGRFGDAVTLLESHHGQDSWAAFTRYNTGVALVRMGKLQLGARLLDKVGTMVADDEEQRALRDRANVALGFAYLQARLEGDARPVLQRVRLHGPFSAKALLGVGWADSAAQDYRSALAAWLELSGRDELDSAVQESLLAVPYAYTQLGAETQAANYYSHALDVYSVELGRIDTAIADAGTGRLVNSLLEQDVSVADGWSWQLSRLPDDESSRYLSFTIADNRFHEALKSYRDLVALDKYLSDWRTRLAAYRDMLATREIAYAERLPAMHQRISEFNVAGMQAQLADIESATRVAAEQHDAVAIAPAAEQSAWQRLLALQTNPAWNSPEAVDLREKQRVLKGLLQWNMDREYRVRLWRQQNRNAELRQYFAETEQRFTSIAQATGSLDGNVDDFAARIDSLEARLDGTQQQLASAMHVHVGYLNAVALEELNGQKKRLLTYRAQASFALASAYDRLAAMNDGALPHEGHADE